MLYFCAVTVELNALTGSRGSKRPTQAGGLALCLGAMLGLALPVIAGEKFTITGSTNSIQLPKPNNDALLESQDFGESRISGGESSRGPVLPPPSQTMIVPSSKLEELLDRKKNWLQQSPETLDRDRIEETFGIRRYEFNGLGAKPRQAMERYFEATKDDKSSSTSPGGRNEPSERGELGRATRESPLGGGVQRSGIIEELNPAYLFDWEARPDSMSQFGDGLHRNSIFTRGVGASPFGQTFPGSPARDDRSATKLTERSWDFRNSELGGFKDPINDPIDPTRSAINPTSPRKAAAPSSDPGQSRVVSGFAFGGGSSMSTRPSFLDGFQGTAPGAPNFKPSTIGPAKAPPVQAKPMILEIPRPSF